MEEEFENQKGYIDRKYEGKYKSCTKNIALSTYET